MDNEKLMELCRLNNVGLFLTCHGTGLHWHACESLGRGLVRSGFGYSPEIAIASCKVAEFRKLNQSEDDSK